MKRRRLARSDLESEQLLLLGCKLVICENPGRMQVGQLLNLVSSTDGCIGSRMTLIMRSSCVLPSGELSTSATSGMGHRVEGGSCHLSLPNSFRSI
jgi:hypothetical protein